MEWNLKAIMGLSKHTNEFINMINYEETEQDAMKKNNEKYFKEKYTFKKAIFVLNIKEE